LLEAGLGHEAEARQHAVDGLEYSERLGDRIHVLQARGVLGFLELSLGKPAAAAEWLGAASDELIGQEVVELGIYPEVVPNEIEARIALGERDRAQWLTGELEARARRTGRPWMCATAARSRSLLHAAAGELDLAREQLQAALAAHQRTGQPFELARTLTVLGALKRRSKRRRASRAALNEALSLLEDLPAPLWTARVAAELARLGEQPPPAELSATEARIAALAAAGRTNPEIAAEVFVSRKTVEANLSSVYRKLGLRSRVELARRFGR
jgi:DNA-binding CsgD family transcriptional regulator